jgi:hypothetical protein
MDFLLAHLSSAASLRVLNIRVESSPQNILTPPEVRTWPSRRALHALLAAASTLNVNLKLLQYGRWRMLPHESAHFRRMADLPRITVVDLAGTRHRTNSFPY